MLLSIIVPIYNVEKYLHRCIESIVNQNMNDYELLLIDDCSTDASLNVAKQYGHLSNIKIIEKRKNSGLSDTRNIGLKEAVGRYVLFLDSDDYIEENSLQNIQNIIYAQNSPDVVYFGFFEEDANRVEKKFGYVSSQNHLYSGLEFAKSELRKRNLYAAACFGIYKRDFLIQNNLFFKVGIYHEDELWTPQVVIRANSIYAAEYAYYHYVRRADSITRKANKTQNGIDLINSCKELDQLLRLIDDKQLYKYMDNHIAMLYMKAMSEGKLFQKETRKYVDRFYPLRKTCFYKDKFKAILFALSLRCYYLANNIK